VCPFLGRSLNSEFCFSQKRKWIGQLHLIAVFNLGGFQELVDLCLVISITDRWRWSLSFRQISIFNLSGSDNGWTVSNKISEADSWDTLPLDKFGVYLVVVVTTSHRIVAWVIQDISYGVRDTNPIFYVADVDWLCDGDQQNMAGYAWYLLGSYCSWKNMFITNSGCLFTVRFRSFLGVQSVVEFRCVQSHRLGILSVATSLSWGRSFTTNLSWGGNWEFVPVQPRKSC